MRELRTSRALVFVLSVPLLAPLAGAAEKDEANRTVHRVRGDEIVLPEPTWRERLLQEAEAQRTSLRGQLGASERLLAHRPLQTLEELAEDDPKLARSLLSRVGVAWRRAMAVHDATGDDPRHREVHRLLDLLSLAAAELKGEEREPVDEEERARDLDRAQRRLDEARAGIEEGQPDHLLEIAQVLLDWMRTGNADTE